MIWDRPWALSLFILLPIVLWLTWRTRSTVQGTQKGALCLLQLAACTLAILALAGPWPARHSTQTVRIVIAMPAAKALAEQMAVAWRTSTPQRDAFYVATAGATPHMSESGSLKFAEGEGVADVALALRQAAAVVPSGQAGEIVFVGTADHSGAPLAKVLEELSRRDIRVHWRAQERVAEAAQLLRVRHPSRADLREPITVRVRVSSPIVSEATIRVLENGTELAQAKITLRVGESTHAIAVLPQGEAMVELETRLAVGDDTESEKTALFVEGKPRVLYLGSDASALQSTLAPHGIHLAMASERTDYADYDAVVVDDLRANAWAQDDQKALLDAVLKRGTGLLLTGAYGNLGPGGYGRSPLAEILPVEMPQREERRDPSVALVLIVDTSGSMGNRIELAKEVARLAIKRLLPHDKVGIVEFYGAKRWAAPLQPAANTIELQRALNRMQAGGGTVIYSALEESYYALLNVRTRFKHILVLTDGGVEQGPFEALARRMANAGMNLNTVLIGPQSNSQFLLNMAQWGRGRFYAAPSRFQLPELRFKEPQTTMLPAVQERSYPITTPRPSEVTAVLGDSIPGIGGVVEAHTRQGAERLLVTNDGKPLLTGWDQGNGRVLVHSSELLGPMADAIRKDPKYGAFLADTLRSLARGRQSMRPRLLLTPNPTDLHAEFVDGSRSRYPAPILAIGDDRWTMAPIGHGVFVVETPWTSSGALTVDVVDQLAMRHAVRQPTRRAHDVDQVLKNLVAATGGSLAGDLPVESRTDVTAPRPITSTLAMAALITFFLSILVRRWPTATTVAAGVMLISFAGEPASAQDPVRDRIIAELRNKGQLDDLTKEWANGSLEQRLAIAEASGDLGGALKLLEEGGALPEARALWLEAKGETASALAAVREILPSKQGMERAQWSLREGELSYALGEKAQAIVAWQRAITEANSQEFTYVLGHMVGGYGFYDFALQHHDPRDQTGKPAMRAHLRRAYWQKSAERVDEARNELEKAYAQAPLKRDRRFVLARIVALMRQNNRLENLVAEWQTQKKDDPIRQRALLNVLRELGRGQDALALLEELDIENDDTLTREALSVAVEAGQSELAVTMGRKRLDSNTNDVRLRIALGLLLTDLRKRDEAIATLKAGMRLDRRKDLLLLMSASSELALEEALQHGLEILRSSSEEKNQLQAVLSEAAHLKSRQLAKQATQVLLDARPSFDNPQSRVRLAEALESSGRAKEAIPIYSEVFDETKTEDLGMRLAWLLGTSKNKKEKAKAAEIFRRVWLSAGSPARRVQAEERVLDLASRNGSLADLAIELEEALEAESTEHRDAKREALVKIYTRAQDTFAAAEILKEYAKESGNEVEAWQKLANIYLENEEFRRNEKALRHLLTIDSKNELDYRQQLALNALERGRMVEARQIIEEMFANGRIPSPVAFEFAAGIYTLASRHKDAARLYRRALAIHPDRIETLLLWANAMSGQDKADLAIGRFCILVTQEVKDDLFLIALDGMLNLSAGKPALRFAERAVRRRIAQKPDKVYLHRMLQDILEALGDKEGRVASLEDTLLVAGQQRTAWLRELMEEANSRRDWPSYLGHGRALLASGDEVPPQVFLDLGEALLQTKDLRAAERAFGRARLAPDFASIERRVAGLYEQMGYIADAERVRRRILRRDPDNPVSIIAVAKLAERRGSLKEALNLYQEVSIRLFDGTDFEAKKSKAGRQARFNRNKNTSGIPAWEDTLTGVLRCSTSTDDLSAIRNKILARCEASPSPSPEVQLSLIERLRQLANAWDDTSELTRVRELEDRVLADERSTDKTRAVIFAVRLEGGDLAGAEAAIHKSTDAAVHRLELALRKGDIEKIVALAPELAGNEQVRGIKALQLLGETDAAEMLLADLVVKATTDKSLSAFVSIGQKALGIAVDETKLFDDRLAKALESKEKEFSKRWGAINQALRGHKTITDERKTEIFQTALPEALKETNANFVFGFLRAAKGSLTDTELAPLVVQCMEAIDRAYLLTSRAPYLKMLPTEQAIASMKKALDKLSDSDRKTQALRLLADKTYPKILQGITVEALDLAKLAPVDEYSLTNLCNSSELEPEAAASVLTKMKRYRPKDPRTTIYEARLTTDPTKKAQILTLAAQRFAQTDTYDYKTQQAIDAVARQVDDTTRAELLSLKGDTAAVIVFRAELLRMQGDATNAADLLTALCKQRPDDALLLRRVTPILQELGRKKDLLELTLANAEHSPRTYPYQAGQLARQLLEVGRAGDALAALRKATDTNGTNLRIQLRVVAALKDPEQRAQEARLWLQERQRILKKNNSRMFQMVTGILKSGKRITPQDLSKPPITRSPAPATAVEAETIGQTEDLLAFFPEGRAIAETMRRCLSASQRDANPGLYRALLASSRLTGDHEAILANARAVLAEYPADAESLRIMFAAAQIGMPVSQEELELTMRPLLLRKKLDPSQLIDLLITANAQGHAELCEGIAKQLLSMRSNLMRYQMRGELVTILAIAAQVTPNLLWKIIPDSPTLSDHLDGDLIATLSNIPLAEGETRLARQTKIHEAFAATLPYLEQRSPHHWGMRLALPYAGLELQLGNIKAAKRSLATNDPQVDQGDQFSALVLAAAIPPLDTWQKPEQIDEFSLWLTTQIQKGSPGQQILFARLAVLCAMRLDAAGKPEDAKALMAKIKPLARGIADAREWLEIL